MTTVKQAEAAVLKCIAAGQNPHGYCDYADLRRGKENWEYFVKEEPNVIDVSTLDQIKYVACNYPFKALKQNVIDKLANDIDMSVAQQLVDLGWTPPIDVAKKLTKKWSEEGK